MTATPTGMLTRKIQCQLSRSVSTPPASTPTLPPPAATKPMTPIALVRSAGSVNSVITIENATTDTTAPPSPCTARAAMRNGLRRGQAAGQRGRGEEREAADEEPAVAEQVAEPAAQQQEAAEGQQVGVDDPGQRGLGEAEVLADRGQRHVHDRRVEDDHQRCRCTGRRGPASGRGGRARSSWSPGRDRCESVLRTGEGTQRARRTHRSGRTERCRQLQCRQLRCRQPSRCSGRPNIG